MTAAKALGALSVVAGVTLLAVAAVLWLTAYIRRPYGRSVRDLDWEDAKRSVRSMLLLSSALVIVGALGVLT